MDLTRIALLQSSFEKLSAAPEETALLFYARLFATHPEVRPMFTTPLAVQAQKFMAMLSLIVTGLHRPATIIGEIKHLGERHVAYGTRPAHYEAVGAALLWAIEQRLGPAFTPEVHAAWHEAYFLIAGLMKEAVEEDAA
jgi:hemoglobin-like flavoprotein